MDEAAADGNGRPRHVVWSAPKSQGGRWPGHVTVLPHSDSSGTVHEDTSLNSMTESSRSTDGANTQGPGQPLQGKLQMASHQEAEEDDDEGDEAVEETAELGPPMSIGSHLHAEGKCTPCGFMTKRKWCRFGQECEFCHYPHAKPRKKKDHPSKAKRDRAKKAAMYLELSSQIVDIPSGVDHQAQVQVSHSPAAVAGNWSDEEDLPAFGVPASSSSQWRKHIVAL